MPQPISDAAIQFGVATLRLSLAEILGVSTGLISKKFLERVQAALADETLDCRPSSVERIMRGCGKLEPAIGVALPLGSQAKNRQMLRALSILEAMVRREDDLAEPVGAEAVAAETVPIEPEKEEPAPPPEPEPESKAEAEPKPGKRRRLEPKQHLREWCHIHKRWKDPHGYCNVCQSQLFAARKVARAGKANKSA